MKKALMVLTLIGLIICLFIGCNITTPSGSDGVEDEGEAESTQRVVMVELFVAPTCSHCPTAKEYIARLLDEYGFDKLVVLEEYGWNYGEYTGWATSETTKRFFEYVDYSGSDGGTPDTYFNGLNQRIGHDNYSYWRYKKAIMDELDKPLKVTISANYEVNELTVNIEGSIKNINSGNLDNIVVGAMVYEDSIPLGSSIANHVVRDIITSDLINNFSSGESLSFSLESEILNNVKDMSNIHVVVYVQAPNSSTKEILQALYVN